MCWTIAPGSAREKCSFNFYYYCIAFACAGKLTILSPNWLLNNGNNNCIWNGICSKNKNFAIVQECCCRVSYNITTRNLILKNYYYTFFSALYTRFVKLFESSTFAYNLRTVSRGILTGVPTSVDLENNSSQKKYTVNKVPKGHLVISKLLCCLMALGALVLIALAAVATFFLLPKCASAKPEALVTDFKPSIDTHIDKRLPRSIEPQHYR